MKKHGPIRGMIENMKMLANATGLTLEQIADFYDATSALEKSRSSTDASVELSTMTPAKGKH